MTLHVEGRTALTLVYRFTYIAIWAILWQLALISSRKRINVLHYPFLLSDQAAFQMPVEMYPLPGPKRPIPNRYVVMSIPIPEWSAVLCTIQASVLFRPFKILLQKPLHIKVTPDLHLTYSKNGGNLGLVLKMKNIACLSILLTKHVKYSYLYFF